MRLSNLRLLLTSEVTKEAFLVVSPVALAIAQHMVQERPTPADEGVLKYKDSKGVAFETIRSVRACLGVTNLALDIAKVPEGSERDNVVIATTLAAGAAGIVAAVGVKVAARMNRKYAAGGVTDEEKASRAKHAPLIEKVILSERTTFSSLRREESRASREQVSMAALNLAIDLLLVNTYSFKGAAKKVATARNVTHLAASFEHVASDPEVGPQRVFPVRTVLAGRPLVEGGGWLKVLATFVSGPVRTALLHDVTGVGGWIGVQVRSDDEGWNRGVVAARVLVTGYVVARWAGFFKSHPNARPGKVRTVTTSAWSIYKTYLAALKTGDAEKVAEAQKTVFQFIDLMTGEDVTVENTVPVAEPTVDESNIEDAEIIDLTDETVTA